MRGEIGTHGGFTNRICTSFPRLSKPSQRRLCSRYFTSLLLAFPCYPRIYIYIYIYFFFRLCFLAPSHSALLNPIYHIIHHLYSFTSTHTHHRSRFLPFSFQYNLPNPHPHRTGIPIPVPYNTILCVISIESV